MVTDYPIAGFHFRVQLLDLPGGSDDGAFQEATGLSAKMETESYREGGENRFAHRLPKGVTYEPLKLTSGVLATERAFATWCRSTLQGNFAKPIEVKMVQLELLQDNVLLKAWKFEGAWPIRWELAGFSSMEGKLLVETLELGYDYFEVVPVPPPPKAPEA